jgi:hypothetical protein
LGLDDLNITEGPEIEEAELSTVEEPIEIGELSDIGQLDELGLDDSELSLVDLSDESINMDFSVENAEGDTAGSGGKDAVEFSLADSEIILEESPKEEMLEEAEEPDISLDTSFSDEEISLDNFEEETLDLTGAVIEEPDLGAEIKENPIQEPALDDIAMPEEGFGESGGELSPEAIPQSPEEPALEVLEELDLPPLEEIGGEVETSGAEEGTVDLSPARGTSSRGENLDQIIPEGFVVEELEDEGETDFGGLEEALDEIPGVEAPENDKAAKGIEAPDEPDVSALPGNFKTELKQVLSYMDQLLESLPEEKIEEFAKSEYFDTYKKLFKELGLA